MNDILQQFKIVLGLDDKPLQQGIQKSENSLKSFGKVFGGLMASYFSYEIFKGAILGFAEFNTKLAQSIELTGGSVENISAMGNALKRFGGDTQSVISSMESLNSSLQEAKFVGGALVEVSKKYGLAFSPFANAEDTLQCLAFQMSNYNRETRVAIGRTLGLDDSLIRAFADGGKELENLIKKQKQLGVITQEDIKVSKQFNNAWLDLKDMFSALMRDISRVVLPIFTKLFSVFYDFMEMIRTHKQVVIGFFVALGVALTPILLTFGKMAIASVAAFAPIYAVVAVITTISVITEDIYYYFKGWDSVTGKLVEKFPVLASVLEVVKPLVVGIFDTFGAIVGFLKDPSWDNFANIFKTAGKALVDFSENIKKVFTSLMEEMGKLFSSFLDTINPLNWFGGNEIKATVSQVPIVPQVPMQSSTINTANNSANYNINNNFNQNITGANSQQVANDTNKLIINSINQQSQQFGAF